MKRPIEAIRTRGVLTVVFGATLMLVAAGGLQAQARIDGIDLTGSTPVTVSLTARAGEVSTADGGSIHFWGYAAVGAHTGHNGGLGQYPGPTLIVTEGSEVEVSLTSDLPFGQCTSILFPGHRVTAGGGTTGVLTQESCDAGDTVTYDFTATEPGTYTYHSGTQMELQVEMGLVGAIIVRPNLGEAFAYNDIATAFDHEYLFLLTEMDPVVHALAEQGRFPEIDSTAYWPVYWFINGRAAPDTLAAPFVSWLPHQPYNILPRTTPGDKLLMRLIGGGQHQHPYHYHGNNADIIARDGRMLSSGPGAGPDLKRSRFTTLTVPGQTVDQIFEWTGEKLGFDIYGTPTDGMPEHFCDDFFDNESEALGADGYADLSSDYPWEWCADHDKAFPVILPEALNLTFGGWWSGSPFMGSEEPLPPGEGGLNPNAAFVFMWHSHAEKELTNFDIFPGGMMTQLYVEPPGTPIP